MAELPQNMRVAVTRRWGRPARSTAWPRAQGYDAVHVVGGMVEWEAVGRSLASETGQPPVLI